jgi:hypothetical protein
MGIETKLNPDAEEKRFEYRPRYASVLPMSAVYESDDEGNSTAKLLKGKDEDVSRESLERIVTYLGGSAQDARQAEYAFARVKQIDDKFVDSGKYERLADWCGKNRMKAPEKPMYHGVSIPYGDSNKENDAVAWTMPEAGATGVNTYIDDKINAMSRETGLSEDQVEELIMTHEYMHNAQDLEKLGGNVLLIEANNELNLANYFHNIAENSADEQTKERYEGMAEVCLGRYYGITNAMGGAPNTDEPAGDIQAAEDAAEEPEYQKAA